MQTTYDIQENNGKFTLAINGIFYNINEITYFILDSIKQENPLQRVANEVEQKFGVSASEKDIAQILEQQINPLFEKQHKVQSDNAGSFWFKKELLTFNQYETLIKPIRFLYNPVLFWTLFFPVLFTNLYWLFNTARPTTGIADCGATIGLNLAVYGSLFLLILIHELGHAASALKFNVKAKSIGFGFYSIFPVFFADITGIWPLSKNKRMITNLAGIFIQGLLGILIYLAYRSVSRGEGSVFLINLLYLVLMANALTMLINLFPFFKFDGYWCYSDLFDQPNLGKRSKILVLSGLRKLLPIPFRLNKEQLEAMNLRSIPLWIYTFFKSLTNIFLILFIGSIILSVMSNIGSMGGFSFSTFSWCTAKSLFMRGVLLLIVGRLMFKYTKVLYKVTANYFK